MNISTTPVYRGVFPVVPTTFTPDGDLDLDSQKRCIDFMIDAGSDGLCILGNFSEQYCLGDAEREVLTRAALEHVRGRVPVIVTTSHFSTRVSIERSRSAQAQGAAMVMALPPYHGATIRVSEQAVFDFYAALSDGIGIPILVQDAPVSGTNLPVELLVRMAREIEHVSYFKIECANAAAKLTQLCRLGRDAVVGPWDGEEAITLLADLEAGATGAMTGGGYPDGIRKILDAYTSGDREQAAAEYARWLPLINYENRQCGPLAAKVLMKEGGVIACDLPRAPLQALRPDARSGLLEIARRLDPLVLHWAR
jgi:2-keto-3-deoxy-L-arabinonate dehydratase